MHHPFDQALDAESQLQHLRQVEEVVQVSQGTFGDQAALDILLVGQVGAAQALRHHVQKGVRQLRIGVHAAGEIRVVNPHQVAAFQGLGRCRAQPVGKIGHLTQCLARLQGTEHDILPVLVGAVDLYPPGGHDIQIFIHRVLADERLTCRVADVFEPVGQFQQVPAGKLLKQHA